MIRWVMVTACLATVACGSGREVSLRVSLPNLASAVECSAPARLDGMRVIAHVAGGIDCPLTLGNGLFAASGSCQVTTGTVRGILVLYDLDLTGVGGSGIAPLGMLYGALDLTEKALDPDDPSPTVGVHFDTADLIRNQTQLDIALPRPADCGTRALPKVWARCFFDEDLGGTLQCGGGQDNLTRVCTGDAVTCP